MTSKWYCILLDGLSLRGNNDIETFLWQKMRSVFGNDLVDVRLMGERISDTSYELFSESYIFVCCKNYQEHINDISRCNVISLVLPSINRPEEVDPSHIERFAKRIDRVYGSHGELTVGDIVHVKGGYLENLYGIVVDRRHNDRYDVFFRLYTRQIKECLYRTNLVSVGTLFNILKFPVVTCNRKLTFDLLSSQLDCDVVNRVCKKYIMRIPIIMCDGFSEKKISTSVDKSVRKKFCENKVCRKLHRSRQERC